MDADLTRTQWPLRPLSAEWLRGPAWIDGDDIVMDCASATTYHALAESEIGIELARVKTPQEAVAFVERFGLLGLLPRPRSREEPPWTPRREPFRSFEVVAEELRDILQVARLVRSGADGNTKALRYLHNRLLIREDEEVTVHDEATGESLTRRAGDVYSPYERFVGADSRTILMFAHEYLVARPLSEGIADLPARVHDRTFLGESVPPGSLRVAIKANSLGSVCYLSVALALADRMPVAVCADPTCRRPFFPADKRQRFCSRACGNRVRFRRFTDRHGSATTSKEGN